MSPWTIIGWTVVAVIGLAILAILDAITRPWLVTLLRHYRTRNTPPRQWQEWMQGDGRLTITRITDNGRICLTTGLVVNGRTHGNSASWSDSPEEWRARVKARRLWLVKDGEP